MEGYQTLKMQAKIRVADKDVAEILEKIGMKPTKKNIKMLAKVLIGFIAHYYSFTINEGYLKSMMEDPNQREELKSWINN